MEPFSVPNSLRQLLLPVLERKFLRDDKLWQKEILPQLRTLFESLEKPSEKRELDADTELLQNIQATVARIRRRLSSQFSRKAPFTIHRLAELLLAPKQSGYSLLSPKLTLIYLHAILRVVSVSSAENSYLRHQVVSPPPSVGIHKAQVSTEVYELHDLPTNICFVPLDWDDTTANHDHEGAQTGTKRQKLALPTEAMFTSPEAKRDLDMAKLGSYLDEKTPPCENSEEPLDQDSVKKVEKVENQYPVQLLSPLNTEKTVDKESKYEDGSINYEKQRNEELRV